MHCNRLLACLALLLLPGIAFAQAAPVRVYSGTVIVERPPVVYLPLPAQPPSIPGACVVPAWEYANADANRDGITTSGEIMDYCHSRRMVARPALL